MIPYGRQNILQADIDAVVNVLRSDFLTQGPQVPLFEHSVANHVGAKYSVAVNSATSALHIACLALGVGPGDWVWTTPISFVASANCALYCGAKVDFVDIDPYTYNLCPQALESKLISAEKSGKLPKLVIAVHLCGQSCDMAAIHVLSHKYGFKIIEDASHAIGGKYKGQFIGSGDYSDITVFSFHPVKIITTAEGGMALTNDNRLAGRMQRLRSHGITSNASEMLFRTEDEIWNYQQVELGFNYRMTEIQAALGISQLVNLDEWVLIRNTIAMQYTKLLSGLPLQLPWQHPDSYSAYHLYPILLSRSATKVTQRQLYEALHAKDIRVNLHYIPIYLQPYYIRMGFQTGYCPNAEAYFKSAISIPMYPTLSKEQIEYVAACLRGVLM